MDLTPYALVVVSAFTHAYWNFLLKKTEGTQVFIGLSKISEVFLFAVPFGIAILLAGCPLIFLAR